MTNRLENFQRRENADLRHRRTEIILTVVVISLLVLLSGLSRSTDTAANAESQDEASVLNETDIRIKAGVTSDMSLQGQANNGSATNKTSINIDTNLPAEVKINGEEVTVPEDGTATSNSGNAGSSLNFSINSSFSGDTDGDFEFEFESESEIDIDNDIEETFEVNN